MGMNGRVPYDNNEIQLTAIIVRSYRGPITSSIFEIHEITIDEHAGTFNVFCGTIYVNFARRTSSSAAGSVGRCLGKSAMLRRGRNSMGGISIDICTGGCNNTEVRGRSASYILEDSMDHYVIDGKVAVNNMPFSTEKFQC